MQNAKCFELYTPEGALIFRAYLVEREMPGTPGKTPAAETSSAQTKGKEPENGERMTSPQAKKLFRLLAAKGFEGDKAQKELERLFQVEGLEDVGKFEASRMIDRLVKETKGGNGNGSSL
jgi:hypothetical protein